MKNNGKSALTKIQTAALIAIIVIAAIVGIVYYLTLPPPAPRVEKVYLGLLAPFTGTWAYVGDLYERGALLAIDEINGGGGIKSLDGAKIEMVKYDAGASSAECTAAFNRMIAAGIPLSAIFLPFPSGYVVTTSELAEREKIPLLHTAWTEGPHLRGFKYLFRCTTNSTWINNAAIPTILEAAKIGLGRPLQKVAFVYNDNPATLGLIATWKEICKENNIELVVDEMYTSPLRDATPMMLKVQATKPDLYITYAAGIDEEVLMWAKAREMELEKNTVFMSYTGARPQTAEAEKELIEGKIGLTDMGYMKGLTDHVQELYEKSPHRYPSDLKFMSKDTILSYGVTWLFKEAVEKAASADPVKIRDALESIDITSGPATVLFGRVRFDAQGELVDAFPFLIQWNGKYSDKTLWPDTIYPVKYATAEIKWAKTQ